MFSEKYRFLGDKSRRLPVILADEPWNTEESLPMVDEQISSEIRIEIREYLTHWTLPQIEAAFRAAEILPIPNFRPPVIGTRRVMVERHFRSLDFGKAADVQKFTRFCAAVIREIDRRLESRADDVHRAARVQILQCFSRAGFTYEDGQFVRSNESSATLSDFRPEALSRRVARIDRQIDADPLAAVGVVQQLVTTCCLAILAARGKPVIDGRERKVSALVRRVSKELELRPDCKIRSGKAVTTLLDGLVKICQSVSALEGYPREMAASHARLAVGSAAALCAFLHESHEARPVAADSR